MVVELGTQQARGHPLFRISCASQLERFGNRNHGCADVCRGTALQSRSPTVVANLNLEFEDLVYLLRYIHCTIY